MYFRARFYDPATGEFISQDPLEYVDGMSMYRSYLSFNRVDPKGSLSIFSQGGIKGPAVFGGCGGAGGWIRWSFDLDPNLGALENGYIIQKVRLKVDVTDCKTGAKFEYDKTFYEVWRVVFGQVQVGVTGRKTGLTDRNNLADYPGTWGYQYFEGTVAFIPDYVLTTPPWQLRIDPGHIFHARDLPTLYPGPPAGWAGGDFQTRTMRTSWVCCDCPLLDKPTELEHSGWTEDWVYVF